MKDQQHLGALQKYWKKNTTFPSMPKLCDVLGLSSTASVFALIGRLSETGYLERVDGRIAPTRKFFSRRVLGHVRAGLPEPAAQEEGFELLNIDDHLVAHPERTTFCHVRGDSMKDVGLMDGDIVVVEANRPTKAGDIVVAVIDSAMTVKTLRLDGKGAWFLEAANPAFAPIHPKGDLEILGVVVGSFRTFGR